MPAPLVLLHGSGQRPPVWQDVVTDLGADRPMIAPWLKGLKPGDRISFDLATAAATVASELELRGAPQADVCGLNLGALVALRMAVSFPGQVRRLVVVSGFVVPPKAALKVQRTMLKLVPERRLLASGVPKKQMIEGLDAMIASDMSTTLADVRVPVLVVAGADDPAGAANAEQLRSGLPDARVVTISGAGADVVRDQPAALAAAMREFLDA
ncbi:MAG TPA: alpha/beta hydrolase [Propionibacteriaceae bacterium]|nr:alpha/beta hydrolase [Propionibacteriaceae bacterium]HPZ50464.1 alpha/beta hydrolase [Propionibacteriaceae bacterium]HQE30421.1 alpha/beta hydrolase [Propionibacteriaceae bacterium]